MKVRTAVYRAFSASDDLLYIGISKHFGTRWRQHAATKPCEVEADRRLLDLYERAKQYRDRVFAQPEPRSISDEMRAVTQMMALEQVMRLRAAIWSDHPDYRQD